MTFRTMALHRSMLPAETLPTVVAVAKTRAPRKPRRSQIQPVRASGSDFGRLDLQELAGARDRDRPRLHRLRNLAHEVNVQEPVLQTRAFDLDMVGELEATLEGPRGDPLVEHLAGLLLVVGLLFAANRQPVLLRLDRQIGIGEAGNCDRDANGLPSGPDLAYHAA